MEGRERVRRGEGQVAKAARGGVKEGPKKSVPMEKSIVAGILKYLNGIEGCHAVKTHGSAFSGGQPDVDVCFHGQTIKLEVKRPGKKATVLQEAVLEQWKAAGAVVGVVTSVDEVKEIIKVVASVNDLKEFLKGVN